jgi:Antirestriction protein (ArdA)
MADIIDLRDLKGDELKTWKQAIEDQTGYKFEELADNEPAMISNSYFEQYAQELAEDIGAINKSNEWPIYCIDWERATRELKMDYTSVDMDGETYWFRAY